MRLYSFFVIFCAALSGCTLKEPPKYNPSEADQAYYKIVNTEFGYKPVLKQTGRTLWIYLPGTRQIFTIHADQNSPEKKKKFSLEHLNTTFEDRIFTFEYEIVPVRKEFSTSQGLANDYSKEFKEEYRNMFTAVARVYLNSATPPLFIVLVFSDVKNGVEAINTLCFEDLKKYQSGYLPEDEYALRILNESHGDPKIINDEMGQHLEYHDITWPEFLGQQIIKRVNFKYTQSDFEPGQNTDQEILKIIKETFKSYQFTDFASIRLHDLGADSIKEFSWLQLFQIVP